MPDHFSQAVGIALIGLLVAFVALAAIALIIALIGLLDRNETNKARAPQAPSSSDAAWLKQRPANATVDDLTLVLISSAVAAVLQGRGRVRHVRRIGEMTGSWAMKGRLTVQGSHVVTGNYRGRGSR